MDEKAIHKYLAEVITWGEAHADWKAALADFPAKLRGEKPAGAPHTAWQLLEHCRIAQWDIIEFSRDPKHVSPDFPAGYWPKTPAPPSAAAWEKSVKEFEKDSHEIAKIALDPKIDLTAPIPHGSGQTMVRQILLLADHNSYHLGQLVLLRRLLGAWSAK
jgi:DinB family protein